MEEHNRGFYVSVFWVIGVLFGFGFGEFRFFFLAEAEHLFWEQYEYMQTLGFFVVCLIWSFREFFVCVFCAINTLLEGIPKVDGYCRFKGCFPV